MPVPGRNVAVLVDEFNMSAYFNEFEFEREAERIDVSTFGRLQRAYLAGPQESTVTLTGFYDGGNNQVDHVFHNRFGQAADILITLCPDTAELHKACYLTPTTEVTYNLSAEVEDAVEIEGEFAVNGAVDRGHILHAEAQRLTTGSAASLDNGAATTKGASAHLHVIGGTVGGTTPSVTIKVEHSTDNSSWADLMTFTAFSVVGPFSGKQRIVMPTGVTVNRYTRATHTIVGASSNVTYALALARGI